MSRDCCNPFVADASAISVSSYYTNQGFLVQSTGSATASSTLSQADAQNQANIVAQNVANDAAKTLAGTIDKTLDIIIQDCSANTFGTVYTANLLPNP